MTKWQESVASAIQERQRRQATARPTEEPLSLTNFAAKFLQAEGLADFVPLAPDCLFHEELCAALESSVRTRPTQQAWLAPRGFAKSSYVSYAFPLWATCEQHERYTLIISETDTLAAAMLRNIRRQLERNHALLDHYPDARRGLIWREDFLELRNGCVIQSVGTGAAIRGARQDETRPTCVLADDLQKKEHVYSELQRQRAFDWFKTDILPLGSPRTNIFVLGTALHRECIACQLQGATGWKSRTYRAIMRMPERMDLWGEWQNILHERRSEEGEQAAEQAAVRALTFYRRHETEMNL